MPLNQNPSDTSVIPWADAVLARGDWEGLRALARQRHEYADRPAFLYEVGEILRGNGLPTPDLLLARGCFELAAEGGHARACLALWGVTLHEKRPDAFSNAWPILLRAARLGSVVAMDNLLGFQRISEWSQLPEMLGYLEVLSVQGNAEALRCLGQAWDEGLLGLSKNKTKAFFCYLFAAQAGDRWGMYYVGIMYAQGLGVAQSDEQAVFWYSQAAALKVADAQSNLGYCYELGRAPLVQSMSTANDWYRLAAMNSSAHGQFNLAQSYRTGKAVPCNEGLAHQWYLSAAKSGHADAAYYAARGYEQGAGVEQDSALALAYFAQAVKLGSEKSVECFERLAWRVADAKNSAVRNEGAGRASQDVCVVLSDARGKLLVLADGAGGCAYGAQTGEALIAACRQRLLLGVPEGFDWADWLEAVDRELAINGPGGLCTVVLLWLCEGVVSGASVGDSQAWLVRASDVFPLTAAQARRPLMGTGKATVTAFGPCVLEGRLVVASDGLWLRVSAARVEACVRQGDAGEVADALVAAARLSDGELVDDLSLIVIVPESVQ